MKWNLHYLLKNIFLIILPSSRLVQKVRRLDCRQPQDQTNSAQEEGGANQSSSDRCRSGDGGGDGIFGLSLRVQHWLVGAIAGAHPSQPPHRRLPRHRCHQSGDAGIFHRTGTSWGPRGLQLGAAVQVEENTRL